MVTVTWPLTPNFIVNFSPRRALATEALAGRPCGPPWKTLPGSKLSPGPGSCVPAPPPLGQSTIGGKSCGPSCCPSPNATLSCAVNAGDPHGPGPTLASIRIWVSAGSDPVHVMTPAYFDPGA